MNDLALEADFSITPGTPSSISLQLCKRLERLGLTRAEPSHFHDISNSFLSKSLYHLAIALASEGQRTTPPVSNGTLPLTLVVLFCSIIRRLSKTFNIQAKAVNFPGVVLAAVCGRLEKKGEEEWIFVDVSSGSISSRSQCESMMDRMGLTLGPDDLKPSRASDMVRLPYVLLSLCQTTDSPLIIISLFESLEIY